MARSIKVLPEKDPAEKVVLTFDYTDELDPGETISGAVVASTTKHGTDGDAALVADGLPSVLTATVLQRASFGLDDVQYLFRCLATTSNGRVLLRAGVLPVRRAA